MLLYTSIGVQCGRDQQGGVSQVTEIAMKTQRGLSLKYSLLYILLGFNSPCLWISDGWFTRPCLLSINLLGVRGPLKSSLEAFRANLGSFIRTLFTARHIPVIPTFWDAETGELQIQAQLGQLNDLDPQN